MNNQTASDHIVLDSIESALEDIKNGKMIIVVDNEDRENEGDLVIAAEYASPEVINFMTKVGRGLICAPLTESRCRELNLLPMVMDNTDKHQTAFTVSVDLKGNGNTTGISAQDRARTIAALVNDDTRPDDLSRPGHIFPLIARELGVLRRSGHTEAAIDFARLAGLKPAGVIVEIMNNDGSMARLPQLKEIALCHNLKVVSIEDLIRYRLKNESLVEVLSEFVVDSIFGRLNIYTFSSGFNEDKQFHYVIKIGSWIDSDNVSVRVCSSSFFSDLFNVLISGGAGLLPYLLNKMSNDKKGLIVYLNQKNGFIDFNLLNEGNKEERLKDDRFTNSQVRDEREIGVGAQILRHLNVSKMILYTNNSIHKIGLAGYGIDIVGALPLSDVS